MAGAANPTRDPAVAPGERGNAAPPRKQNTDPVRASAGPGDRGLTRGSSVGEAAEGILGLIGGADGAIPAKPRRPEPPTNRRATDDDDAPESHQAGDTGIDDEDGPTEDDPDELVHQRDDDAPPAEDDELDPDDPGADDVDPDADLEDEPDPRLLKRKVRVKSDGVESVVTIDELRRGYQRHQTFSRKTEELAATRRQVEAAGNVVMQQRQALDQVFVEQLGLLQAMHGDEPDWQRLSVENPTAYVQEHARWAARNADMQRIQGLRVQNAQLAQQQAQQARAERMQSEGQRMLAERPEFADPVKGKAIKERIVAHAKRYGFDPAELGSIGDARIMFLLADAASNHARLEKAAAQLERARARREAVDDGEPEVPAAPRAPRTAPPGPATERRNPPAVTKQKELTRAKQAVARTGRVEDAANAISKLL